MILQDQSVYIQIPNFVVWFSFFMCISNMAAAELMVQVNMQPPLSVSRSLLYI